MKKKINNTVDNRQFIRPIHYCDNAKSSTPWILLDRIRKHRQDRGERMGLFTDLLLIKPIHETLFHPEYLHSVMHEREWRYVSSEHCFTFEVPHINSVVVPQSDYQQWLNTKSDPIMDDLMQFCDAQNLSIEYI